MIIQSGHEGDHAQDLFRKPLHVCPECDCIFIADKVLMVNFDNTISWPTTDCPECGEHLIATGEQ